MHTVYSLGEVLIDFLSTDKGTYQAQVGGAPLNVAGMITTLGGEAHVMGSVGTDYFGHYIKAELDHFNISTKHLYEVNYRTMLAFVNIDEHGDRDFSFYHQNTADLHLKQEMLKQVKFDHDILHFCSVSLKNRNNRRVHRQAIKLFKKTNGVISFDPNLRLNLWENKDKQMVKVVKSFIKKADIIKLSEEELVHLTKQSNELEAIQTLKLRIDQVLLVTRGKNGASVIIDNHRIDSVVSHVKAIDTTGAGDALIGAVLYQVQQRRGALEKIDLNEWKRVIDEATMIASKTTLYNGAIPSYIQLKEQI